MNSSATGQSNDARRIAATTFLAALQEAREKAHVTEVSFVHNWLSSLSNAQEITVNGWYDPPSHGVAVLSGLSRIGYTSLRFEESWPGEHAIDWEEGALFAYSSSVNMATKIPGDFSVTLYFGHVKKIREHYNKSYAATWETLTAAKEESSSRRLYEKANRIFAKYGLRNRVATYASSGVPNLGHTLPRVDEIDPRARILQKSDREAIRAARNFLNSESDWDLSTCGQFTMEPQLIDIGDSGIPPIGFHYVILPQSREVLDEPDSVLRSLGLLPSIA